MTYAISAKRRSFITNLGLLQTGLRISKAPALPKIPIPNKNQGIIQVM